MSAIETALTSCPKDFTPTMRLVAAALFAAGDATSAELEDVTGVSSGAVYRTCQALVEAGLARECEIKTSNSGRNPKQYTATLPADGAFDLTHRQLQDRVICELAKIHYRKTVSSATTKQLARAIGREVEPRALASAVGKLSQDGIVEQLNGETGGRSRWRLVAPEVVAPFTDAEAEQVVSP